MKRPYFEIASWPADEIILQMAYDKTQSADFQAAYKAEKERERQMAMTPQQRAAEFARALGLEN